MDSSTIPAFLSIDVEPDGFQLDRRDPPPWTGYVDLIDHIDRLRADLTGRTGHTPQFGWYVRTDPQIAEVYGRPDHALVAFPECAARLQAAGDYWGVHSHPIRRAPECGQWVHEFGDGEWLAQSTPVRAGRLRSVGGGTAATVPGRRGVPQQSHRRGHRAGRGRDRSHARAGPQLGRGCPHGLNRSGCLAHRGGLHRLWRWKPYRPARRDFRVDGGRTGRRLLMVPLTTRSLARPRPWWWRAARRVLRGPAPCWVEVLYPASNWPDPAEYWDAVAQQLRSMRRPYLSLGIRTDAPNSEVAVRVRRVLDALPRHPLAARLSFENPLTTFRDSLRFATLSRGKTDHADAEAGAHRTSGSPRGSTVTRS